MMMKITNKTRIFRDGEKKRLPKKQKVSLSLLTSGSSGKMLSTRRLYRGLSAPQQPQTPEEGKRWRERREKNKEGEGETVE